MPATLDARVALGDMLLASRRLAGLLDEAHACEWSPAPRQVLTREDVAERRSTGPYADPTAAVALDDARLVLRQAARDGDRVLRAALASVEYAEARLAGSLEPWRGTDHDGTDHDGRPHPETKD
jgi:hypothetical protein